MFLISSPALPSSERVECNVSEEEILRRALQNGEIRELAEGKDLIFLITPFLNNSVVQLL